MLLSELTLKGYADEFARAELRSPTGRLLAVDRNAAGDWDIFISAVNATRVMSNDCVFAHKHLDPIEAQAVLYHYLGENKPVPETTG